MNRKWITYGALAVLVLAGCQKPASTADQSAQPNAGTAANQGTPQQQTAQTATSAPEAPRPFVLPEGTSIPVVLTSTISSKVNKPGEEFEASLAAPVMANGEVAIPKGALARGIIVDAKKQGMFKGAATLAIRLTSLEVRGKEFPIDTDLRADTEKGKGKRTAVVTGGGAAVGALIGGLAGGGKGAAIGAAVGGGGGLAASGATGGKNAVFPAESRLTFRLRRELIIER